MTNQEPHIVGRNGLQELANRGIPDGACTALLGILAIITLAPYLGGLKFGTPGSLPEVVSLTQFWIVVSLAPVAWLLLFSPIFGRSSREVRRWAYKAVMAEALVLAGSFPASPAKFTKTWTGALAPGDRTEALSVTLPEFPETHEIQVLLENVSIHKIEPDSYICGHSETKCIEAQLAMGVPYDVKFSEGKMTVSLINYKVNPPVTVTLAVSYTARRYTHWWSEP